MANLKLEQTHFLNEGNSKLIGKVFSPIMNAYSKHYDKKYGNQHGHAKAPNRDEIINRQCKFLSINPSFFNLGKEYKTLKDLYSDMEADAKFIASKILTTQDYKDDVDGAIDMLKRNKVSKPEYSKYYFKNIFDIKAGKLGYAKSMQILDPSKKEWFEHFSAEVGYVGDVLELKYKDYISDTEYNDDGYENEFHYQLHLKDE